MNNEASDMTINVLPLGKAAQQGAFDRFIERWHVLCKARKWNGLKVNLGFDNASSSVSVGGGRFRLEPRTIHVVSETPRAEERESETLFGEWLTKYKLVFLVCDTKELLQSDEVRHEMAFYRMGMRLRGRYFDCYLLLVDSEEVLDIDYTGKYPTTMIGVCTAFSSKGYNKTRLTTYYQQLWNELASEYIGQIWGEVKTQIKSHRFLLPANLLCTNRLYTEAGYMEALQFSMDRLFVDKHLNINGITKNKLYNDLQTIMRFKLFNRNSGGKEIRLAVIGQTSSGKTYLLVDLCQAIAQMGYTERNDAKSPFRYVGQFINKVVDPEEGTIGTPQYICRQENHYKTNYQSVSGGSFSLEFIDIPGDYLTCNSIEVFIGIIKALTLCEDKIFNVYTWNSPNDKKTQKIVKFESADSVKDSGVKASVEEDQQLPEIGLPDIVGKQNSKTTKDGKKYNSEKEILPTSVVEENLKEKGYTCEKKIVKYSGQKLLEDFYQLVSDTVINAIVDAWDVLDIQIDLKEKTSKTDAKQGINDTDSPKTRFVNVYKSQFYFLYFCLSATDIVLCDKMAVPSAKNLTKSAEDEFSQMSIALKTFKSLLPSLEIEAQKNWYMVFKGADSIIVQNDFQKFHKRTKDLDEDATYSLFLMLLAEYLKNNDESTKQRAETDVKGFFDDDDDEEDNAKPPYLSDENVFVRMLTGKNDDEKFLTFSKKYVEKLSGPQATSYFFKPSTGFYVPKVQNLFKYITERKYLFCGLVGECTDTEVFPFLGIPPHMFFAATPIDRNFNIYGHDSEKNTKFSGCVNQPEQRLCFGTLELLKDLLLQNDLALPTDSQNYGALLAYIFGGK